MNEDFWLVVAVALVWALLAAVYALAPGLDMPGYARVWGIGALLFLGLGLLLLRPGAKPDRKQDGGTDGKVLDNRSVR